MNRICAGFVLILTLTAARGEAPPDPKTMPQKAAKSSKDTASTGGDTTPSGMVAFFMATACATGWNVATTVQGRLVVGVTDPNVVGVAVGTAMANQTAPEHSHSYTASLTMDYDSVSATGCCNNSGAAAKTYSVPGTLTGNTANLPFIQLVVCQKQ